MNCLKVPVSLFRVALAGLILLSGCVKLDGTRSASKKLDPTLYTEGALSKWDKGKAVSILPSNVTSQLGHLPSGRPAVSVEDLAQALIRNDPKIAAAMAQSKIPPIMQAMIAAQAQKVAAANPGFAEALYGSSGAAVAMSTKNAKRIAIQAKENAPGPLKGPENAPPPPPPPPRPPVCPVVCAYAAAWAAVSVCAWAEATACAYATASCTNADGTEYSVESEMCAWGQGSACAYAAAGSFAMACAGG